MNKDFRILIYAPSWRENAAGIKVLYLLCHLLNSKGLDSYIVPISFSKGKKFEDLEIRYVSENWKERRALKKSQNIVIYTETILGNPLKSTNVIRYYLNYPGLLTENLTNREFEVSLPYSENIYHDLVTKNFLNLLRPVFISTVKLSEIQIRNIKKDFISIYASKYRRMYGKPKLNIKEYPLVEIFGFGWKRQSRADALRIISESKALISFENSAIVTEAVLSHTPVYLVENSLTSNPIASFELGEDGVRPFSEFGNREIRDEEFVRAHQKFQESIKNSEVQILGLIESIQTSHLLREKNDTLKIRHRFLRVFIHKALFFKVYLRRVLRRFRDAND